MVKVNVDGSKTVSGVISYDHYSCDVTIEWEYSAIVKGDDITNVELNRISRYSQEGDDVMEMVREDIKAELAYCA